jgi:demethylmenaquinone methyltransferase/2-methoxy-6-polyprenyl-1,4-benzoquinol methylase
MKVLDVASGTGLMARGALDLGIPERDLVGLDPSRGMLQENRKASSISLIQGLGERLPFCIATFDFISMGYALRHVEDLGRLFREFHRVLRVGGRILILEITRPSARFAFTVMRFYMQKLVPLLTRLAQRHHESARLMKYYWATIAECVPPEAILSALRESGFHDAVRRTSANILSEYLGTKN